MLQKHYFKLHTKEKKSKKKKIQLLGPLDWG